MIPFKKFILSIGIGFGIAKFLAALTVRESLDAAADAHKILSVFSDFPLQEDNPDKILLG